jgi:type I restriction enzyme, S subunit
MEVKPGYKQTEVGVIPEEWGLAEVDTLGSIIDGDRGRNYPKSEDFSDSGHCLFLNAGNVTKEGFRFTNCAFITREKDERLSKGHLKRDDIVLTTRGTVGNLAYFDAAVPFEHIRINSGMVILRNESPVLNTTFLYILLKSHLVQSQIERLSFGSAQPQLTVKGISKFAIIIPGLLEQQAIAEALSDADALIESLEQLIAKKRLVKQGAMQELLTGKRRLPGFSGEWVVKRLGETAILKARIGWQGLTTAEYLDSGNYYLVTGTEFKAGYVDWNNCHYVTEPRYDQDKYIQLKEHDVLVTKDGTIGKVALVTDLPKPATLNSGVFVIRPINRAFHPEFFYYLLCSQVFMEFLVQLSAGSTINHLYQKDFVDFSYKIPPSIEEQTAIAAILSDMDAEIAALEAKLVKARQVKQGMMQELLTGRIRLV